MTTRTGEASENVSAVVRMLLASRRDSADVLAGALGISRTSAFDKVNGRRRWYADEVQAVADYFDVPVTALFDGPDGLLRGYSASVREQIGDWFQPPLPLYDTPAAA